MIEIEFDSFRVAFSRDIANELLQELAKDVDRTIKSNIKTSIPRGRTYRRGSMIHVASAPGQPPAIDTGNLFRRIGYDVNGLDATFTAGTNYANFLEVGTRNMQQRPFFDSVLEKYLKDLGFDFSKVVEVKDA